MLEGQGDVICKKNALPSSVKKGPTIAQQDIEDLSDRILDLVTEFADILMIIEKQAVRRIKSELVDWLNDTSFKINTFKWFMRNVTDCEDVFTGRPGKIMKDE